VPSLQENSTPSSDLLRTNTINSGASHDFFKSFSVILTSFARAKGLFSKLSSASPMNKKILLSFRSFPEIKAKRSTVLRRNKTDRKFPNHVFYINGICKWAQFTETARET